MDEKPKVQQFLSCLPYHIKDKIEYDNLKTLDEAMRKVNLCYEQDRKKKSMTNWKDKNNNNTRNFPTKNFQGNKSNLQTNPNNQRNKEYANNHGNYTKNFERKEPIKCWECNGLLEEDC